MATLVEILGQSDVKLGLVPQDALGLRLIIGSLDPMDSGHIMENPLNSPPASQK